MKQQNHYAYDIPAEYADIIDPSKVNLSDFALFLAVMKRKKAHECVKYNFLHMNLIQL